MKELLASHFDSINGLIHCSGGGQTKCLKYVPENVRIIKDKLFEPPVAFQLIQQASHADDKEMYQVFNMGTRLEIYTNEKDADKQKQLTKQAADLAMLSQGLLKGEELTKFIKRSVELID